MKQQVSGFTEAAPMKVGQVVIGTLYDGFGRRGQKIVNGRSVDTRRKAKVVRPPEPERFVVVASATARPAEAVWAKR